VIRPVTRDSLLAELADWLAAGGSAVRVAVDGPPCAGPHEWAAALADPLRARGRRLEHVLADLFWRDASLRLEHGREDAESFRNWLDADTLRREVLASPDSYLPSLRDPVTNRSTRAAPRPLDDASVLVVSGSLLLGRGLPFDAVVHLAMSPAARRRHTPSEQAWTLPAFLAYDDSIVPLQRADVVVRLDDPARPAVSGLPAPGPEREARRGADEDHHRAGEDSHRADLPIAGRTR